MIDPVTEAEAFDGNEDVVCGFRPSEEFRIPVARFDEVADIRFKLPCESVDTPLRRGGRERKPGTLVPCRYDLIGHRRKHASP